MTASGGAEKWVGRKPIASAKRINRLKASGQSYGQGASSTGQIHIETAAKQVDGIDSAITGDQTETSDQVHIHAVAGQDGEITGDQIATSQATACGQPVPKLLNTNEIPDYRLPLYAAALLLDPSRRAAYLKQN